MKKDPVTCDGCKQKTPSVTTSVIGGKFGNYCAVCLRVEQRHASPQAAQYHRDRDREAHQRDMLQPWVDGKINREFAREYPDSAKDIYSEDELKEV